MNKEYIVQSAVSTPVPLIKDGDLTTFTIQVLHQNEASVTFEVRKIEGWNKYSGELESIVYLKGCQMWDDTFHLNWGDPDGYLCAEGVAPVIRVLNAAWDFCKKLLNSNN